MSFKYLSHQDGCPGARSTKWQREGSVKREVGFLTYFLLFYNNQQQVRNSPCCCPKGGPRRKLRTIPVRRYSRGNLRTLLRFGELLLYPSNNSSLCCRCQEELEKLPPDCPAVARLAVFQECFGAITSVHTTGSVKCCA